MKARKEIKLQLKMLSVRFGFMIEMPFLCYHGIPNKEANLIRHVWVN